MADNVRDGRLTDELAEYRAIKELVERTHTENPSPEDRLALRRALESSPNLWRWAGDVARHASEKVITTYAPESAFYIESMRRGLDVMREGLGYETALPLERMMIEQVLTCWLHVNLLEILHCDKLTEYHSTEAAGYWDGRLSAAQRRFTRACESLARVRKLEASRAGRTREAEARSAENTTLSVLTGTH